jgi:hypothetical protein
MTLPKTLFIKYNKDYVPVKIFPKAEHAEQNMLQVQSHYNTKAETSDERVTISSCAEVGNNDWSPRPSKLQIFLDLQQPEVQV